MFKSKKTVTLPKSLAPIPKINVQPHNDESSEFISQYGLHWGYITIEKAINVQNSKVTKYHL